MFFQTYLNGVEDGVYLRKALQAYWDRNNNLVLYYLNFGEVSNNSSQLSHNDEMNSFASILLYLIENNISPEDLMLRTR